MLSKRRIFLFFTLLFILGSCSSGDEQFCECLKLSDQLNSRSQEALNTSVTEKQALEIRKLSAERKEKCADYGQMDGEQLRELQSHCK